MSTIGTQTLVRYCFYPQERFTAEPLNSIELSVCEELIRVYQKMLPMSSVNGRVRRVYIPCPSRPIRNAPDIPRHECRGLTARFDKATWDEWLFGNSDEEGVVDKGEALAEYVQLGRCVIMGSQTAHYHLS